MCMAMHGFCSTWAGTFWKNALVFPLTWSLSPMQPFVSWAQGPRSLCRYNYIYIMTFIDIHIISYNMYIQYILTDAGCTMLHPQKISGSKVARAQRRGRCGKPNRWTAGASNGCERCWYRPPYSWMLGRVWAWWICRSMKFIEVP